MNQRPFVSIIIDNYNYGHFLRKAIDSALQQTYPDTEIIVVDDGSIDNSAAILHEYGDAIRPVFKNNGGQASAFNEGFLISSGEVIIFLDADDTLLPTAVEQVVDAFSRPRISKIHWPMWRIDRDGKRSGDVVPAHPLADGDLIDLLVQHGPAYCCGTAYGSPTSGNAWSRQFLEQVFPLPEVDFKTGGVDFYLFVLAPVYGQISSLSDPQGCYRVHGSNDTLKSLDSYLHTFFGWFEQVSSALKEHLLANGTLVDADSWERNSWYHQVQASLEEIIAVVPPESSFTLIDEHHLGTGDLVAGRRRIPLMEQDGQYWGPPGDDASGIQEIERHRLMGSHYVFFAWPSFWWLTYYSVMHQYLKTNYTCVIHNDRLIGYSFQAC